MKQQSKNLFKLCLPQASRYLSLLGMFWLQFISEISETQAGLVGAYSKNSLNYLRRNGLQFKKMWM